MVSYVIVCIRYFIIILKGKVMTIFLTVIYVLIGICVAAIILLQEGNTQGLGSIGGMADSYWGKNKARSMEGALEKFTKIGVAVFFVIALALNILMK